MIVNILSHTPVWVWGLLAALMALSFSQTRQRDVAPWRLPCKPDSTSTHQAWMPWMP